MDPTQVGSGEVVIFTGIEYELDEDEKVVMLDVEEVVGLDVEVVVLDVEEVVVLGVEEVVVLNVEEVVMLDVEEVVSVEGLKSSGTVVEEVDIDVSFNFK